MKFSHWIEESSFLFVFSVSLISSDSLNIDKVASLVTVTALLAIYSCQIKVVADISFDSVIC